VRYFNGILFVFTLAFLKCADYRTDFGTRMEWLNAERVVVYDAGSESMAHNVRCKFIFTTSE